MVILHIYINLHRHATFFFLLNEKNMTKTNNDSISENRDSENALYPFQKVHTVGNITPVSLDFFVQWKLYFKSEKFMNIYVNNVSCSSADCEMLNSGIDKVEQKE